MIGDLLFVGRGIPPRSHIDYDYCLSGRGASKGKCAGRDVLLQFK